MLNSHLLRFSLEKITLVVRFRSGLPVLKIETNFMGDLQGEIQQKTHNISFFSF